MSKDNPNLTSKDNTNLKTLPFNTEQLLKAVEESSKRSRTLLLMLTFTSFLVTMALVNSLVPKFNWFKSKTEISKDILKYVVLPSEFLDKSSNVYKYDSINVLDKLSDYIVLNEKILSGNKIDSSVYKYALRLDKKYPLQHNFKLQNPNLIPVLNSGFSKRQEKYDEIGNSLLFLYQHNIFERQSLLILITKLDDAQVEHLDLIRVPILGISFHVNYLGVYSGFLLTTLLVLFYFSLLREKINLKITFKRGWIDLKHHHYYLYEYASMLQVLSIPKKLFSNRGKKNWTYTLFSKAAIYFPLSVYSALFIYDLSTIHIGTETNFNMTTITILLSLGFFVAIIIYSLKVAKQWLQLDILWDNQAYEFNLEYILEAIGEDEEIDLIDLFPPRISKQHLNEVKFLWYSIIMDNFKNQQTISKRKSTRLLSNFINRTFRMDFEKNNDEISLVAIENIWTPLKEWFNSKGKKNVNSNFRSTLCDTINGLGKL